jgi:hypothetical protein
MTKTKGHKANWFEAVGRSTYQGPLKVTKVLLKDPRKTRRPDSYFKKIILSVPASCGNAVERNRFRRVMRELIRQLMISEGPERFDAKEGVWLVLSRRFRLERDGLDWTHLLRSALSNLS